jgi:hypothetical protein
MRIPARSRFGYAGLLLLNDSPHAPELHEFALGAGEISAHEQVGFLASSTQPRACCWTSGPDGGMSGLLDVSMNVGIPVRPAGGLDQLGASGGLSPRIGNILSPSRRKHHPPARRQKAAWVCKNSSHISALAGEVHV